MLSARLNILVALPAEAKSINRLLGLRRLQPDGDLPLYVGGPIALVLAGPGMAAAAAGTAYLHHINTNPSAGWLNLGIAGHRDLPTGQVWLATQVIAPNAQESWQLDQLPGFDCACGALQTFSHPVTDYPSQAACDMEAAGFVAAASTYTPLERIYVLKVISDNLANPIEGINTRMVRCLIEGQSRFIRQYIERILREDV